MKIITGTLVELKVPQQEQRDWVALFEKTFRPDIVEHETTSVRRPCHETELEVVLVAITSLQGTHGSRGRSAARAAADRCSWPCP